MGANENPETPEPELTKEQVQEELRFARMIRDTTDRDDATEMVEHWEGKLKAIMKKEEAANG